MKNRMNSDLSILRQKAEQLLNKTEDEKRKKGKGGSLADQSLHLSEAELLKLIYELETHKLELKMQNQQLLSANNEAEIASKKYIKLYNLAPSGYITLSKEGEIVELNICAAELLGKNRTVLKNSRFGFFVSYASRPVFNHFLDKVFESKVRESCEIISSVAGKLPAYLYLTGIADVKGDQCQVIATDITKLKQSEISLRESEENLRKLQKAIENAKVSVVITDKDGTIEFANPFFTQLSGYTTEEYMGKKPSVLKSGVHAPAFYQQFWETIESGKTWEGEFCNKKKSGELYWEKAIISPIFNEKNEITHYTAIKTDITEAKKNNEELIAAKLHAEESDNLKTAFLNNISHEIRTPFNGILGFLSILQNDDLNTAEREEYTKVINESAYRLMNTINDICEVSQIQTGQIYLNESKFSISQIIADLIDAFKSDFEIKGLTFTVTNQVPLNMTHICTDHLKLMTILNNLLSNAIKFTRKGSVELSIRVKDTTELEFSVKDTGIGIPENKLQTIFKPFVQADSSNTRQFEGSGLGITIAKAYVELLGGTIWVESSLEKGSVFRFTIPYRIEGIRNTTITNSFPDELKKQSELLKILIVEDDEASAMFLSITIKPMCKNPLIARTGVEAVEACRKNPDIDLVLMDIKMPEMDGYEATRQIRQFNTDMVIIAQTAYALTGDLEKAIASGCNDYITKPVQKEHLMAIVQKYFKLNVINLF